MHLHRDPQGSLGVVFMADWRAEQGQQRVAREFLDIAAVPSDGAAQLGDDGVDHLEQLLGVEAVRQRREARDVGEQRRDEASLLGE